MPSPRLNQVAHFFSERFPLEKFSFRSLVREVVPLLTVGSGSAGADLPLLRVRVWLPGCDRPTGLPRIPGGSCARGPAAVLRSPRWSYGLRESSRVTRSSGSTKQRCPVLAHGVRMIVHRYAGHCIATW